MTLVESSEHYVNLTLNLDESMTNNLRCLDHPKYTLLFNYGFTHSLYLSIYC